MPTWVLLVVIGALALSVVALVTSALKTRKTEAEATRLRDMVAALSKDALRENRQDFLENAHELLKPVRETLDRVQSQLAAVDKDREGSFRAVAAQLSAVASGQEQLRLTTENLARSLRS